MSIKYQEITSNKSCELCQFTYCTRNRNSCLNTVLFSDEMIEFTKVQLISSANLCSE